MTSKEYEEFNIRFGTKVLSQEEREFKNKMRYTLITAQFLKKKQGESLCCCFCEYVFKTSDELQDHKKIYVSGKKWKCPECGKMYQGGCKTSFAHHVKEHKGKLDFVCTQCGKQFATEEYLACHRNNHKRSLNRSVRTVKCHTCDKLFQTEAQMKYHFRIIHLVGSLYCEVCGKCFTLKTRLKIHLKSHSDERPLSCTECGQVFKTIDIMKTHIRFVHKKEKKFSCSHCRKAFPTSHKMKTHELIHTGEIPFNCNKCGKGFTQKGNMQTHVSKCIVIEHNVVKST